MTPLPNAVVFQLSNAGGFYSVFFFLCQAYIYAKANNLDFYITSTNWYYRFDKGWHDYLTSLNQWDPKFARKYSQVLFTSHMQIPKGDFKLQDYMQAIKEIYHLKPELEERANEILAKNPELISVFVRRGDKITYGEAPFIETPNLLKLINMSKETSGTIFVQTDDYRVIVELEQELPNVKLIYTVPKTKFGSHSRIWDKLPADERKIQTEEMLVGLQVCIKSRLLWTDFTSNVGRFLKLSNFDNTRIYASDRPIPELILDKVYQNLAYGFLDP
jgi:hypothetical protein